MGFEPVAVTDELGLRHPDARRVVFDHGDLFAPERRQLHPRHDAQSVFDEIDRTCDFADPGLAGRHRTVGHCLAHLARGRDSGGIEDRRGRERERHADLLADADHHVGREPDRRAGGLGDDRDREDRLVVIADRAEAPQLEHVRQRVGERDPRGIVRSRPVEDGRDARVARRPPIGLPAWRQRDPERRHVASVLGAPAVEDLGCRDLVRHLRGGRGGEGQEGGKGRENRSHEHANRRSR